MTRSEYRFDFSDNVPVDDIEDSLMLAALAAEALHGRAAMKLDASFSFNKNTRVCIVDAKTTVGCDIAQILTKFITHGYGESSFKVEHSQQCSNEPVKSCATGAAL